MGIEEHLTLIAASFSVQISKPEMIVPVTGLLYILWVQFWSIDGLSM